MFEPIETHETIETDSEQIRTFATAPMSEALKLVRCGFELENQSAVEMSMSELIDFRYFRKEDKEKIIQYFNDNLDNKEVFISILEYSSSARRSAASAFGFNLHTYTSDLLARIKKSNKRTLRIGPEDLLNIDSALFDCVLSELLNNIYDLRCDGFEELSSILDSIDEQGTRDWDCSLRRHLEDKGVFLPNSIEFVEDGSVEGCEIRTVGPQTVGEFCKAVDAVFAIPMDIDEECSFHIHLSLDGVKHSYGAFLQRAMLNFLARNYTEIPRAVRTRLQNESWVDRYFPIDVDRDRYKAIAYRGSTWEFRLFGNIDNPRDAKKCLMLAIKALRYAYRLRFCKPVKEKSFVHRKEMPPIKDIRLRMTGNSSRQQLERAHIKKLEAKRLSTKKEMGKL
jgi:hypothetical protein